ncbi:uncharacterized protein LODBEIA_P37160 [Lodderomyces beijingensis]|uniref:DH domain-containing protein n=1 Tax=Lodderomyces beijingensis TaxID=1775926 RepID=A0ABP0ZMY5_9ASCO
MITSFLSTDPPGYTSRDCFTQIRKKVAEASISPPTKSSSESSSPFLLTPEVTGLRNEQASLIKLWKNSPLSKTPLSESTIDSHSPIAHKVFTPRKDENYVPLYHLQMTLKEIAETERSFVEKMRELRNMYLENLENMNIELPTPVRITKLCLEKILEIHGNLLVEMDRIRNCKNYDYGEQAIRIADTLSTSGVSCFWYSWYCSQHKAVCKMYDQGLFPLNLKVNERVRTSTEDELETRARAKSMSGSMSTIKHLFRGVQNLIESQELPARRRDLSIKSLSQKPIDRIVKYPLFVESLRGSCQLLNYDTGSLTNHISEIKQQLYRVNESTRTIEQSSLIRQKRLHELIDLQRPKNGSGLSDFDVINVDICFFGDPIVIGFASVVSIHGDEPKLQHCPIILFKSHLLIVKYVSIFERRPTERAHDRKRKYRVVFIIPLAITSLYDAGQDDHRLHLDYKNWLKLVFRIDTLQYEVVLCFLGRKEYHFWKDNFELVINEVNGGTCKFKTRDCDSVAYLSHVPFDMSPYRTHSEAAAKKKSCLVPVKFKVDLILLSQVGNRLEYASFSDLKAERAVTLGWLDVAVNERHFRGVISREIPLYTRRRS